MDYEFAFKNNPQPIAKDIYSFAICNILENNVDKSIQLFQQLVDLEYNVSNLSELKNSDLGKILPKFYFPKIENLNPSGIIKLNYALRDSLNKIYERDQYFRIKEESYEIYGDTIKKIDVENDVKLREIILEYGYPNEYLIGVNQNLYPGLNFDITIRNQTTLNHISSCVDAIKDAIWTGKLEPHHGASLIESHVGNDSYLTTPFMKLECINCSPEVHERIKGKIFYFLKGENIEQKNEFREGIYLENFEDFVKKYNYDRNKNKYFKFFYKNTGCSTWQFVNEKDILSILERYTILE
jgi:hypothetical protein